MTTNVVAFAHPTVRALLMLNELHRFGFEQLRFSSHGGHGFAHIFAAQDEVRPTAADARFLPAVRQFNTWIGIDGAPADDLHLASKWEELLHGTLRPNHLAGMFILDFADIARHGFGPDEPYRHWFRGLQPSLQKGLLPLTHENLAAAPFRTLFWTPWSDALTYPGPPPNHYLLPAT